MTIAQFIYEYNQGSFFEIPYCENSLEWEIALAYFPEGPTKVCASAVYTYRIKGDRKTAIEILKKGIDNYPEAFNLYSLINKLESLSFSTEEEMRIHEDKYYELEDKDIEVEVENFISIFNLIGDKFIPGCPYFDELENLKKEQNERFEFHNHIFSQIFKSKKPDEFKNNLKIYYDLIRREHLPDFNINYDDEIDKVYNFFASDPEIYFDGFLSFYKKQKHFEHLDAYYHYSLGDENRIILPDISPVEYLVKNKNLVNDDIFNFLRIYYINDIAKTNKRVLLLYSIIFEKQGYPKASKRYFELANSK